MKYNTESNKEAVETIVAFYFVGGPYDELRWLLGFNEKRRESILALLKENRKSIYESVSKDYENYKKGLIKF